MDSDMVSRVIEVASKVVASGAIGANGHGNVSLRLPGEDEMYFTGAPSLRDHPAEAVARIGLDGTLRRVSFIRSRERWWTCTRPRLK
jgi:hypothetical protein